MIDVEDLSFERPWGPVLRGVSFVARSGVALALVGEPGAGKSTLLRCLAGLETPARGRIRVAGADPVREPRIAHARLGYVADGYGLYEGLSVARSLWYAARSRGIAGDAASATVEATAARLGLSEALDRPVGDLDGLAAHRLAIAQALVHGPRALLLDEPMAGLDPLARRGLAAIVRALAAEGVTVIASTSRLSRLEGACTDLLRLDEGATPPQGVERNGASALEAGLA